jgi:hypothetical protein
MVNLIASELPFYHWTNYVRYCPRNHPLSSLKMVVLKIAAKIRLQWKKPPRCRVNEMIEPNEIRWAVPRLTAGNQRRFP